MADTEEKVLENFLLNIECLDELTPWIDNINIFEILKIKEKENRHSNFIAWILNPNENHSFGDKILKDLTCHIIKNNTADIENNETFNIIDIFLWNCESFNIYPEFVLSEKSERKDRLDILILSDALNVLIAIENKVFSQEGVEQTLRYRTALEEIYPDHEKLFIYLTPDGSQANDYEYWQALSYKALAEIIKRNMKKLNMGEKEKKYIEDYISVIERHIIEDVELQTICRNIYTKHQRALDLIFGYKSIKDIKLQKRCFEIFSNYKNILDLIFENKPDMRYLIYIELEEKLRMSDKNITIGVNSNKNTIFFNTENSRKLFPELLNERKTVYGHNNIFNYEIKYKGLALYIYITISVVKDKIFEGEERKRCTELYKIIKGEELADNWSVRTLESEFLIKSKIEKKNLLEISIEYFNANKENIINSIFENIIEVVESFEIEKLQKAEL